MTGSTGFGDMGRAVNLPSKLQADAQATFSKHQFNLVASDLIGLKRNLPNYRDARCTNLEPSSKLAAWKTSIIIVFHNEAWSTLLRTVHSVIDRTPRALLEEIILVDDASTDGYLGPKLDDYVSRLEVPCHVERMRTRSGLVKARLKGAEVSKGKTLTFLDAHCEATDGWLEPLLEQIAQDSRRVVCPIIDVINENTFEYVSGSATTWGIFDWSLSFHWGPVSKRERARTNDDPNVPLRTPSMAGGLFTISRDYFYKIGSYDKRMIVWGGENVEMSIRIWQCGGELLIVPCSRVGHVFRKVSPYYWPGGVTHVLSVNSLRTALVWLDEYKDFYLRSNPDALKNDYGDISERQELRKTLGCKSFRWYLENIHPESLFPIDYLGMGEVRHESSDFCLDTMGEPVNKPLGLSACHGHGGNQLFVWTAKGELQASVGCVDGAPGAQTQLMIKDCTRQIDGSQVFKYKDKKLIHRTTDMCLTVIIANNVRRPALAVCQDSSDFYWSIPRL
ncbi:hypothetical protein P879_09675 [Paragonimus westermani]|uniref:Polypeptide N-acetylgalactosaminyltransferase n=1 Tax=Paragonimus westermani TaxID=34504 RepID=A0A8T0D478_9TREM|nr:hypothetical protein P879_09675 [Paragonimus westermani]